MKSQPGTFGSVESDGELKFSVEVCLHTHQALNKT